MGAGDLTLVWREGGVLMERVGALCLGATERVGALCLGATDLVGALRLGATERVGALCRGAAVRVGALCRGAAVRVGALCRGAAVRDGALCRGATERLGVVVRTVVRVGWDVLGATRFLVELAVLLLRSEVFRVGVRAVVVGRVSRCGERVAVVVRSLLLLRVGVLR